MILLDFNSSNELLFTIPFIFGVFGFLKKAFKKVKNVAGFGLSFVPGGGIIKQGLRTARQGFGAIIREIKGKGRIPIPAQTNFGTQRRSSFGGTNKILGFDRNIVLIVGLVAGAFILFNVRKRR